MAQICGIQNHQRTQALTPSSEFNNSMNRFVADEGIEFMLHELEPPETNYSSSNSLLGSAKKIGRPRKDSVAASNSQESEEKRLKREARRERKRQRLRLLELGELDKENHNIVKRKRGRPRKAPSITESDLLDDDTQEFKLFSYNCSSNSETLTPPYSEISESDSIRGGGEFSMMEILSMNVDGEGDEIPKVFQDEKSLLETSE